MSDELKQLLCSPSVLKLAVAESITCGRLQARIGAIPGASAFFAGGITAYNLEQKVRHLGVHEATARALNCVSQDVAEQMAVGACDLFNADIAVATTGYAEPNEERRVTHPFTWWAVAHRLADGRSEVCSGMVECPGADRNRAQETSAMVALGSLLRFLRQLRGAQG